MSLIEKTATELLEHLESGEVTAVDVTTAFLDQIEAHDDKVAAYLRVDRDAALQQAEAVDAKRKSGQSIGKLGGLPVSLKDLICTKGEITSCASKMLENFVPPYDATIVTKLKSADAVLLGKTNMDEFAMGSSTENSAFKLTRNPWDLERIPGGSSGGAAACIAASMAPLSIGSDTGGSIRQPAGLCGVVGLKPTYGRVSRWGLVAFASSFDQLGPLAHTAEDTALLLEVIAGHDSLDSTSLNAAVPCYTAELKKPLEGLRIGLAKEHFDAGLDSEVEAAVREAIAVYKNQGATVEEISLPHSKYAIATYYVIAPSEASSNLARYDSVHYGHRCDEKEMLAELQAEKETLQAAGDAKGLKDLDTALVRMYRKSRAEGFGDEVKRRIMLGTYALSHGYYDAYYVKALKVRRLIRNDYDEAFKKVDLIVGPVTTGTAMKIGEKTDDPLAMYLEDLYTVSANLAGIAGVSVPCGFSSQNLPIGLQLQAAPLQETKLLQAAHLFQQQTDWHTRRPELS
jgi:aspartyl-tRNA(Asn)/glutamyl-tRNA(Gln) amidotransferase subunit A